LKAGAEEGCSDVAVKVRSEREAGYDRGPR
jgi:hypothetical protein